MEKKEFDAKKLELLSDEELKEVEGGVGFRVSNAYCEGHITEASCRGTNVCKWHPSRHWDNITGQWVEGWCIAK